MPPVLTWEKQTLKLRNPFRLSYGATEERQSFWIRLRDPRGDEGWGEASIPPYYRVDAGEMVSCWQRANDQDRPLPDEVKDVAAWVPDGPAPARCAIELALFDCIGKRRGVPLYQLLDLPRPGGLSTTFTISIDTPDAMAAMARQIEKYPLIKLKLGSDDDESRVRAVREARPDAKLCVDANAGWTLDEAISHLKWLEKYDIELIEQPLPRDQHENLGEVQKRTRIPIVADESVQTLVDVERLGRAGVRGINLKLMKVGGLTPGLTIVRRARELNMKIMLGCMIETSIGITAAAHLAGLADWLDLDAPLLISNDPFDGVRYDEHARITLPDRPGIGVTRKQQPA
ncbi:MAG: L-Ala-D/L-Glu epimerase [Phycisphaerales bacterium]|jgi:L-alanine-DL-glutamate epimerase-like enolase superfamily enzyme|nr:L-Ala-D/L-Glu epimerase [Phycisphaerales bacterium]